MTRVVFYQLCREATSTDCTLTSYNESPDWNAPTTIPLNFTSRFPFPLETWGTVYSFHYLLFLHSWHVEILFAFEHPSLRPRCTRGLRCLKRRVRRPVWHGVKKRKQLTPAQLANSTSSKTQRRASRAAFKTDSCWTHLRDFWSLKRWTVK